MANTKKSSEKMITHILIKIKLAPTYTHSAPEKNEESLIIKFPQYSVIILKGGRLPISKRTTPRNINNSNNKEKISVVKIDMTDMPLKFKTVIKDVAEIANRDAKREIKILRKKLGFTYFSESHSFIIMIPKVANADNQSDKSFIEFGLKITKEETEMSKDVTLSCDADNRYKSVEIISIIPALITDTEKPVSAT
jgi:hypothetical protein